MLGYDAICDSAWLNSEFKAIDDNVELSSIGCHVSLKDLYAKVEIETNPR